MGNEQSAPAPRESRNRLSKPRTNSSTNAANPKSSGPLSPRDSQVNHVGISNSRYSTLSLATTASELGETRGNQRGQRKRMSIFRSKTSHSQVQQLQIGSGVNIDSIDQIPTERQSKRNSVIEDPRDEWHYTTHVESRPPIRTARMSLQHIPYSQHHARLSLVPEAPSPGPNTLPRRKTEQLPLTTEASEPVMSRTESDISLYAPMRRRSLLQHGVATRNSWAENDSRASLPTQILSQPDLHNYYYNPSRSTSSPLTALANLSPKFGDHIPGERVATPNDLDYGHIGAFKLGSLRITNGTASPSPSFERPSTMGGEEEYTSARQGRGRVIGHGQGQRSNTISGPPEILKAPWAARAESPLRQAFVEPEKVEPLTINTHLPLPEFSLFNFSDAESPTRSLDLAREYMKELILSPFSFEDSPPASPRLEATSKHTAFEDDLFAPEPDTPDISEFRGHRSFDSGYIGELASSQRPKKSSKGTRDAAPKPLAKADSGYSSNVSLRSFKGNQPPAVPAKEASVTPPKPTSRVASSTYSIASNSPSTKSDSTIRNQRSLPALPVEVIPDEPYRRPPPVPLKHSSVHNTGMTLQSPTLPPKSPEQTWAAAQSRPHVVVKPHHNYKRSQSIPSVARLAAREEHKSSHSPPGSEVSSSSSATTSRWRSKSKSRSQPMLQSEPVFTVQAIHTSTDQLHIPSISAEATRRLEERVGGFPVACFPNTERGNPAMRRTISKETLGTIFSVGSAEYREELTYSRLHGSLPPVPVHATIPESPPAQHDFSSRRYSYQPPTAQPVVRKPVRQSLQPTPRAVHPGLQHKAQQDFETRVTSFESISSSLGRSPYDFAIDSSDMKRKQQERAKSMTAQFEADAAARFARSRTVSQESQSSHIIQRTISYDSIKNQNPWNSGSTAASSRVSSREFPPQAHSKYARPHSALPPRRSNPNLHDDGEKRLSPVSIGSGRIKSPPPVSMQTQRKSTPIQLAPRNQPTPPQAQFSAPPPDRTPPRPPHHSSLPWPSTEEEFHDPWAEQRDFWATRKQVARRASAEMQRPESARPSMEEYYHQQQRPALLPPSQTLSHHMSFDNSNPRAYDAGYRRQAAWEGKGYDHTYGWLGYGGYDKENFRGRQRGDEQEEEEEEEEEYYDNASQQQYSRDDDAMAAQIHGTSTSDMLILDRFAGGLGYGYQPGYGLGGSAGTRNVGRLAAGDRKSVRESRSYGLDFSDVPVALHRAGVQG